MRCPFGRLPKVTHTHTFPTNPLVTTFAPTSGNRVFCLFTEVRGGIMVELCNSLKDLRVQMGYTQASLAEMVGVSRKTMNTIENHVFAPSTMLAMQIVRALDVNVHEIFCLKDD